MEERQNTFFWAIAHVLVSHKNYELVSISQDRTEVWLTNMKETVRLKRENINFSIWLKNDLFRTYGMYEQLQRKRMPKSKKFLNTYFTEQLPIDDYFETIESTRTPAVQQLGQVETHVIDAFSCQTKELEILGLYGLDTEADILLVRQLIDAGTPYIMNSLSVYLTKKREAQRNIVENGKPFLTYIFLGIQIIMFLIMEFNGGSENVATLIRFGAKFNPYISEGQWWRLITPIFLHIGLLHLLMNSVALYYIGSQVEKIFGSTKFFFLYIISGVTGVFLSFLLNDAVAAGASGAIFGCFGALLYVGIVHRDVLSKELVTNVLTIIGINLVFGLLVSNVDNAGHIGGLIGGFVMAAILRTPAQRKHRKKHTGDST